MGIGRNRKAQGSGSDDQLKAARLAAGIVLAVDIVLIAGIGGVTRVARTVGIGAAGGILRNRLYYEVTWLVLWVVLAAMVVIGVASRNSIKAIILAMTAALLANLAPAAGSWVYFAADFQAILGFNQIPFRAPDGFALPMGKTPDVEEYSQRLESHVTLRGWLVNESDETPAPLLLYFGGSSEEVSGEIGFFRGIKGWDTALVNYRGFGASDGMATADDVADDAVRVYDALLGTGKYDSRRVAVMGYSLGTCVAVYVAARRDVAAVILRSPLDRETISLDSRFSFFPLRNLEIGKFNTIRNEEKAHGRLLCFIVDDDMDVRKERSERVVTAWPGRKTVVGFVHGGHAYLGDYDKMFLTIRRFLGKV